MQDDPQTTSGGMGEFRLGIAWQMVCPAKARRWHLVSGVRTTFAEQLTFRMDAADWWSAVPAKLSALVCRLRRHATDNGSLDVDTVSTGRNPQLLLHGSSRTTAGRVGAFAHPGSACPACWSAARTAAHEARRTIFHERQKGRSSAAALPGQIGEIPQRRSAVVLRTAAG